MYGTGVVPLLPPEVRRGRLMIWRQIDLVIDVGANSGQYGGALRAAGYGGRILSFEPLAEAFATLSERCLDDPLWDCHCIAVGAGAGSAVLNVSRDLEASSDPADGGAPRTPLAALRVRRRRAGQGWSAWMPSSLHCAGAACT